MKMKCLFASFIFIFSMAVMPVVQAADNKVWNIKYHTTNAKGTWQGDADERFINSVKESTGGRVIITPYWNSSLSAPGEALSMLKTGVVEMALIATPMFPGEFPASDIVSLPFLFKSSLQAFEFMNEIYKKGLLPEYGSFKLALFKMTDMASFMFKKKEIRKLEDFKGLKIRVSSGIANETMTALGATPVAIKFPDLYMSVDRGVVDGLVSSPGFMGPNKIYEVGRVFIDVPMWVGINFVAINQKTWDSFPDDLKAIMEKEFEKSANEAQQDNIEQEKVNEDLMRKDGVKFITLDPKELARIKKATEPVVNNFVKKLNGLGLQGDRIIKLAREKSTSGK